MANINIMAQRTRNTNDFGRIPSNEEIQPTGLGYDNIIITYYYSLTRWVE